MLIIDWVLQGNNTSLCWLIYGVLCIPCVYYMLKILPSRYNSSWYFNFIFFSLLSISLFLLGIIIAFIIVLTLYTIKFFEKDKSYIKTADYPDYQHSPSTKLDKYGEGFGFKVTTKDTLPKSVRQKMLVAINQFGTSSVNKINSMVLSDDVDEMRLYAKSLIEKQEREISHSIKQFTQKLHTTKDTHAIAYYKKQIALLLWEQVYKYLVNNENLIAVLDKIEVLVTESMQVLSDDLELPLLRAKIALRNHALVDARKWLLLAEKNHAPDYKIISYLAEIDFLEKKYSNIKNVLGRSNNKGVIGLQPIISFWVQHD